MFVTGDELDGKLVFASNFVHRRMANPLQRIWSNSRALRGTVAPFCRPFSSDSLVQLKPGEIGMVSGIPDEHLTRRVIAQAFIFCIFYQ